MKLKKFLTIGFAVVLIAGTATIQGLKVKASLAQENNEIMIQNVEMDQNTRVVDENSESITLEKDFIADEIHSEGKVEPSLHMWVGFSIRNIKTNGQETDYNRVISSDDLSPGTSFTYKVSSSITTSIENILSIGAAEFNTKIGLKNSATVSVSKSFTVTCNKTINGKKVKSCTVTFYPKFQMYKFDEYFLESKKTTGYAKVLCGFTQQVKYYY